MHHMLQARAIPQHGMTCQRVASARSGGRMGLWTLCNAQRQVCSGVLRKLFHGWLAFL